MSEALRASVRAIWLPASTYPGREVRKTLRASCARLGVPASACTQASLPCSCTLPGSCHLQPAFTGEPADVERREILQAKSPDTKNIQLEQE
jgi:hypothetical protein